MKIRCCGTLGLVALLASCAPSDRQPATTEADV
jgi:hypothetical protein